MSATAGATRIEPVADARSRRRFVALPAAIFADDPNYVQPLNYERMLRLDSRHNPYFAHAEVALWLAWRDGQPVGRISAQVDANHLARHKDASGQFGFLDAIDDREVFAALLRTAEDWLRARGMRRAVGPFSLSINEESGLLIDGFHRPPYVMMGHARPYYAGHVEALGYAKAVDLFAYRFDISLPIGPRMVRLARRDVSVSQVRFRPLEWKRYEADLALIVDIFNDAWSDNWGFVPMTGAEVEAMARELKPIVKDRYIAIAEVAGKAAAMAVTIPNVNAAIRSFHGRLLPFNWAKLLWRLKVQGVKSVRMPLMGVRKAYQSSRLGAALALGVIEEVRRYHVANRVTEAELSWVLEQNRPTHHIITQMGGRHDKTYRVYQKAL
jgi:hypothetical protein